MLNRIHILISILALSLVATLSSVSQAQNFDWKVSAQEQAVANDFVQYLNANFPQLNAQVNHWEPTTLNQLYMLESHLHKDFTSNSLKQGELTTLSCTKIVCGGSCKTCYVGLDNKTDQ